MLQQKTQKPKQKKNKQTTDQYLMIKDAIFLKKLAN